MMMSPEELEHELLEKRHELDSIQDRIKDLEWSIEVLNADDVEARRRAVDKMRYVKTSIYELEKQRLGMASHG